MDGNYPTGKILPEFLSSLTIRLQIEIKILIDDLCSVYHREPSRFFSCLKFIFAQLSLQRTAGPLETFSQPVTFEQTRKRLENVEVQRGTLDRK